MASSDSPAKPSISKDFRNPFGPQSDMVEGKGASASTPVTAKAGPRLSFAAAPSRQNSTRGSIQFSVPSSGADVRKESIVKPTPPQFLRRMSSPPPPSTYQRGVSFDTFSNRDATDFSLTLNYKHKNYQHTRRSRTFLCGTDQKDYSEFALEWLIDELVDEGDEIVCLRVVEKDSKLASETSADQGKYLDEAQKLFDQVIAKNSQDEKAISLVMELAVGKVQDIIQRMIQIYEPAVLVVGTRGRNLGGMQGLLPGSVSKYCLQQSPIPVIVVRPGTKRMKKKKKRMADPSRRDYNQILSTTGGHVLEKSVRDSVAGSLLSATDQEAAAVAKAIGLLGGQDRTEDEEDLTNVIAEKGDVTSGESPSPTGHMSPETEVVLLKSPLLEDLDSPIISEGESEEEEDDSGQEVNKISTQPGRAVGAVIDEVVPEPQAPKASRSND